MKYFVLFFVLLQLSCIGNRRLPERNVHVLAGLESLPFENYFEVEKGFINKNLERHGIATKDLIFVYRILTFKDDLCNLRGTIVGEKLDSVKKGFKGIVGAMVFDSDMNLIYRVTSYDIIWNSIPLRSEEVTMVDEAIKKGFFVFLVHTNCSVVLGYNGKQVDVFHEVDDNIVRFE